jgi:hypothetical protein
VPSDAPPAGQTTSFGEDINSQDANIVTVQTSREALLDDTDTVCLVSTMKSGTHWLRYIFANYMNLHVKGFPAHGGDLLPVSYNALQSVFSPVDRRLWLRDSELPVVPRKEVYPFHGVKNVYWQHVDQNLSTYQGLMVYIYRNPLDYAVSRYFYDRKLWAEEGRDVTSVASTLRWSLRWYGEGFRFMRRLSRDSRRVLSITYEELKTSPVEVLGPVFRWVGFPYHVPSLVRAIELSDAKVVREEERRRGKAIVGPTETGFFVRDGSVGQWQQHLSDRDVDLAEKILGEYGIKLANFTLT